MWVGPVLWAILVSAAGWLVFPLSFRLFPGLSDRGYAVSRALGLLLWGYVFWLLTSLGVLVNTAGGILAGLLIVVVVVIMVWRKNESNLWVWMRQHRRTIITVEIIFYTAFLLGLLLRGMDPAALGTEKPMELAFINGFLRSDGMPPLDPWLAGYGISYYYFGYVLVGMLAKLTGVSGGVAFNLGIGLVFSLGAVGAYGVVYNLYAAYRPDGGRSLRTLPLLGPLFVLILSNVEGFLEFIHGRGAFWTQDAAGNWSSQFWTWLNLENLKLPPPGNTAPGQLRYWWWWRASRVVADFDLAGNFREVIDEFPFFSFFLGDLHPHVLVIPFVFVALSLSLNLFLRRDEEGTFRLFGSEFLFSPLTFLLGAVVFGGLGFLNLWDFPWYVVIFAGAHALKKAAGDGWSWERVAESAGLLVAFGLAGVLAYIPFYLSFSSQAGGIWPNVINPTRGVHFWIMFGTLLVPLFAYLAYLLIRKRDLRGLGRGIALAMGVTVLLLTVSLALTSILGVQTEIVNGVETRWFLNMYGAESIGQLIKEGFVRRSDDVISALTLIVILGFGFAILWPQRKEDEITRGELPAPHRFVVLLAIIAGGLALAPEYIYLQDLFETRMNTVFKFYYQAWILWAVAAAYGSAVLLSLPKKKLAGRLATVLLAAVLLVGLTYPAMALNTRITSFLGQAEPALKLDSADNNFYLNPDEQAAAAWLREAPLGTLVEAVHPGGGSYTHYARISMNTGQPALLGWVGHERQWRGGYEEVGSRQADIERLYITGSWEEAVGIIEQYGVHYIVVGNLERTTYPLYEDKFIRNMQPAFQQGSITIYRTHLPVE